MTDHEELLRRMQDGLDRWWAERAGRARTTDDLSTLLMDASTRHRDVLLAVLENPIITDEVFDAIEFEDERVHLAMARHPGCSPAALERLALSRWPDVRELAAEHKRNTSIGRQWAESDEGPDELETDGHVIAEHLLDPAPAARRAYLASVEDAPSSAWEWRHESVVAQHPRAPAYLLERVLAKLTPHLEAIAPLVTPRLVLHQREPGGELDVVIALASTLAKHPLATKPMLRNLAKLPHADILQAVVTNANAPKPDLKRAMAISDRDVRTALAHHPSKAIHDLEDHLIRLEDEEITEALAANPFVRSSCLDRIWRDEPTRSVLLALAGNPNLSDEHIRDLAGRDDDRIMAAVARNPACPEDLMEQLLAHESPDIHLGLATNPEAPSGLLHRLLDDRLSDAVAQAVVAHPNTPAAILEFAYQMDDTLDPALASNPKLPHHLQLRLAAKMEPATVARLVMNPGASAATIEKAYDTLTSLRVDFDAAPPGREPAGLPAVERPALHAVASHGSCPPALLERLSSHRDVLVSLTACITLRTIS
jgi:hypothetical protein